MNAKDKERLHELRLKIWGIVAHELRTRKSIDPFTIFVSQIESHNGRLPKALRLLEAGGDIISSAGTTDTSAKCYQVLSFEKSKEFGVKPSMIRCPKDINLDIIYARNFTENIAHAGYLDTLTPAESIYVWWHIDEYDINPQNDRIYEKSELGFLRKMIMRLLVERKIKEDFPAYLRMITPCISINTQEKDTFSIPNPITFHEFNPEKLEDNLKRFEKENKRMIKAKVDLDAILDTVSNRFEYYMEHIRKTVINDFLKGHERFDNIYSHTNQVFDRKRELKAIFKIFNRFRDLCSYESLYLDPDLGGPVVEDIDITAYIYNDYVGRSNYEEEFLIDEKENAKAA